MAKSVSHAALDAAFSYIADRADRLVLCAGAPDSFTEATTDLGSGGKHLGGIPMAAGIGNGDYALGAGTASGRKLTVARQDGIPVAASGDVDHVALVDTSSNALLLVTTLAEPVSVAAGGSVSVDSFDDEIADPS